MQEHSKKDDSRPNQTTPASRKHLSQHSPQLLTNQSDSLSSRNNADSFSLMVDSILRSRIDRMHLKWTIRALITFIFLFFSKFTFEII